MSEDQLHDDVESPFGDSWRVVEAIARHPLVGAAAEYARLGPERALQAGGILAVVSALASASATAAGVKSAFGVVGLHGDRVSMFLQVFAQMLAITIAMAAIGFVARRIRPSTIGFSADLFTAGTAMLPMALSMLIAAVSGWRLGAFVLIAGFVHCLLLLNVGLVVIGGMSARLAPAVVVLMFIAGAALARAFS